MQITAAIEAENRLYTLNDRIIHWQIRLYDYGPEDQMRRKIARHLSNLRHQQAMLRAEVQHARESALMDGS